MYGIVVWWCHMVAVVVCSQSGRRRRSRSRTLLEPHTINSSVFKFQRQPHTFDGVGVPNFYFFCSHWAIDSLTLWLICVEFSLWKFQQGNFSIFIIIWNGKPIFQSKEKCINFFRGSVKNLQLMSYVWQCTWLRFTMAPLRFHNRISIFPSFNTLYPCRLMCH